MYLYSKYVHSKMEVGTVFVIVNGHNKSILTIT